MESMNPAVQLDFGGIAKGFAIDTAIDILRAHGLNDALVNAGGDLRAISSGEGNPWVVGIKGPHHKVLGAVRISADESVFTSGVGERFRLDTDQRYPHVLNPKTGWPVRGLYSVTVVAGAGALADASATALLASGPDLWPEIAASMGLSQVLVIDDGGQIFLTPEMDQRVVWQLDAAVEKTVVARYE